MGRLSAKKLAVLSFLAKWRFENKPTGPGMSLSLGWRREEATPVLSALGDAGFAERIVPESGNAWQWDITPEGRAALKEQTP